MLGLRCGLATALVLLGLACASQAVTNLARTATPSAQSVFPGPYGPEKAIDGIPSTEWSSSNFDSWYQLTWSTPQSIRQLVLKYELWINGGTQSRNMQIQALSPDGATWVEVAAYTLAPARDTFNAGTGYGYHLFDLGSLTTTAIRLTHQHAIWEVEVIGRDIASLATVTASSTASGHPASLSTDGDAGTSWAGTEYGTNMMLDLEWPSPVYISSIDLVGVSTNGSVFLNLLTWDGTSWRIVHTVSDLPYTGSVPEISISMYPLLTKRIRLQGMSGIAEIQVVESDPPSPVAASIAAAKTMPLGSQVEISGSVTAVFEGAGAAYVERADRTSAIRVEPASGFVRHPANLALTAQATAGSSFTPAFGPANAIDANPGTEWSAASAIPVSEWIALQWSEPKTFDKIMILYESTIASREVTAQVLDGAGNWTTVGSVTEPYARDFVDASTGYGIVSLTFPSQTTTGLRLLNNHAIWELQVYNTALGGAVTAVDQDVTVRGLLVQGQNEKLISAGEVIWGSHQPVGPLGMPNRSLSLSDSALTTKALLATTWGRIVMSSTATEGKFIVLDDGSGTPVKVGPTVSDVEDGDIVTVTGIAGAEGDQRTLRPRSVDDVVYTGMHLDVPKLYELAASFPVHVVPGTLTSPWQHVFYYFRVGDADDDGQYEIILARGAIGQAVYKQSGQLLWEYFDPTADWTMIRPDTQTYLLDVDADGHSEMVAPRLINGELRLCVINGATGQVRWSRPYPPGTDRSSILAVRSMPGMPGYDILIEWDYAYLGLFNSSLGRLWEKSVPASTYGTGHSPAVADMDGDGDDEICFGTTLYASNGVVIWNRTDLLAGAGDSHNDAIRIGDVDADGIKELFFSTGGYLLDRLGNVRWGLADRFASGEFRHGQFGRLAKLRAGVPGMDIIFIDLPAYVGYNPPWSQWGFYAANVFIFDASGSQLANFASIHDVQLGDIDGDGLDEIAALTPDGQTVRFLKFTSSGLSEIGRMAFPGASYPTIDRHISDAKLFDIDRDGRAEFMQVRRPGDGSTAYFEIYANSTPKPPFVRPPTGPLNTQELANSTMY